MVAAVGHGYAKLSIRTSSVIRLLPDEWPRWLRRFDQFRMASGLAADSEEKQVSTLIYCLGEEAEDAMLAVTDTKPKKTYKAVVDTFYSFYGVRRNIIYERARRDRQDEDRQTERAN